MYMNLASPAGELHVWHVVAEPMRIHCELDRTMRSGCSAPSKTGGFQVKLFLGSVRTWMTFPTGS